MLLGPLAFSTTFRQEAVPEFMESGAFKGLQELLNACSYQLCMVPLDWLKATLQINPSQLQMVQKQKTYFSSPTSAYFKFSN